VKGNSLAEVQNVNTFAAASFINILRQNSLSGATRRDYCMKFQIREYKESDQPSVLLVWERSVSATHHFLSRKDFDAIKNIVAQIPFAKLNVHCLVVENKIAGFISVIERKIEMLFLAPEYIGKGLGKELLQFALRKLGACQVDVNEQNEQAVQFYKKSGFVVSERSAKDDLGFDYPLLKLRLQQTEN